MGRNGAQVPPVQQPRLLPFSRMLRPTWPPDLKTGLAIVALVALVAIVAVAAVRETTTPRPAVSAAPSKPAERTRPAFTPAEEEYMRVLWPIHADVERSTVKMTLGQIFYKSNDLDRPRLKKRVDEALVIYQRSEARLRSITPPASVEREHQEYLAAITLFQQSAIEVLKMFDDGRDDHLLTAYPVSQKASDKIREVGGKFWPHEFPPN